MTCGGCSGAVNRVLSKAQTQGELQVSEVSGVCEQPDSIIQYMAGIVSSFDISLEKQEVNVTGSAPYETVLEIIKKTGKTVRRPSRFSKGPGCSLQGCVYKVRSGKTVEAEASVPVQM